MTITGEQSYSGASHRVRFLFGVHEGLKAVKFANGVTYFGRMELPVPLAAARK